MPNTSTKHPIQHLREAVIRPTADGGIEVDAVLISEGKGNEADRHYYTRQFIQNAPSVFNGKKCFADHPSKSEETDRPERSVESIIGYWKNVHAEGGILRGTHVVPGGAGFEKVRTLIQEAVAYAQQFPNEVLLGYSINANGRTEPFDSQKHGGPAELDGQDWSAVVQPEECFSIDLVTFPGAGGKVLSVKNLESIREAMRVPVGTEKIIEALQEKISDMMKSGDEPGLKTLKRLAENCLSAFRIEKEKQTMKQAATPADSHPELQMSEQEARTMAAEALNKAAEGCTDPAVKAKFLAAAKLHTEAAAPPVTPPPAVVPEEDKNTDGTGVEADVAKATESLKKANATLLKENAAMKAAIETNTIETKVSESGFPEGTHKMLRESLKGKSPDAMDKFIEAKRDEYAGLGLHDFGTHQVESEQPTDGAASEGQAAHILRESGLLTGEGK